MTTVSMDNATAEKFTSQSFSWRRSHIFYALAVDQPLIGSDMRLDSVAGAHRSDSRAG